MSTRMMALAGICGAALLAGGGLAMSARDGAKVETAAISGPASAELSLTEAEAPKLVEPALEPVVAPPPPSAKPKLVAATPKNCGAIAAADTGFDPATTPYPVREVADNHQVLKGAAAGAAVGAIGGEIMVDRAGKGAAVGAAAGALGGHVIKKKKQKAADERYDAEVAAWNEAKARYDVALQTCFAG